MKNAIENLDPNLRLRITVIVPPAPVPFAYVSKMSLCPPNHPDQEGATRLLEVREPAATELFEKARLARSKDDEAESLQRILDSPREFDTQLWQAMKADANPTRYLSYFVREVSSHRSPEFTRKLDALIRSSDTPAAFIESLKQLSSAAVKESLDVRALPLKNTRVESFSGQQSTIPAFALKMLRRVAGLKVLYLTERREPIGNREAGQLLELKVKRGGPEKLRAIQEIVVALLGVEIDAFRGEEREGSAELDVDRFLVQANGAGIREALRLILDYEFAQPAILLVEEPEIHLHPALETSMMRYLKKIGAQSQIFITTHSTNFLDTAEMKNVYLTTRNESTKIELIDAAEAEVAIPRELGIRLSSLFMFDRLVFVEGPSDEEVIREWASTLHINLSQACVGFVQMGGVRNLAHFAAEKTLSFLTKRQVRMWFLIDKDEKDAPEINRLTSGLTEQARVVVLERRELENYLIAPRALAKFILLKQKLAGSTTNAPSTEEVHAALLKEVEPLKQLAIGKRVIKLACPPVYPDRDSFVGLEGGEGFEARVRSEVDRMKGKLSAVESTLEKIIQTQTQSVESTWEGHKFNIVPGDILIDRTCQGFGVRFVKERDSARLAALLEEDEIPPDAKDFVKAITH
jgi:hypothetical protein